MQIRLASSTDLDVIMHLIKDCIDDMESRGIYQWNTNYYPTRNLFEEDIKNKSLYIWNDQSNCLGIIVINEEQSPEYKDLQWSDQVNKVLVIHRLAVNPAFQGQGIGKQMMDFAENIAVNHGYNSIRLDAYSGNSRAVKFYELRGYQKVGQLFFPKRRLPFYCYEKIL